MNQLPVCDPIKHGFLSEQLDQLIAHDDPAGAGWLETSQENGLAGLDIAAAESERDLGGIEAVLEPWKETLWPTTR